MKRQNKSKKRKTKKRVLKKVFAYMGRAAPKKQTISNILRTKYILPFAVSGTSFWLMNKLCYCYGQLEGEPFDKITEILYDPLQIADMPILSLDSKDIGIPLLIAIMIHILLITRKKKKLRSGEEHGSAKWADDHEIFKFMDKNLRNNIILTMTEGLTLLAYIGSPVNGRNKNVLVIGSSGSGKTRFFVIPNIMQMHSSYVVTDPKGTILENVGYMLKKGGYKIKVINLVDTKKSMHYNPLAYVKTEQDVLKFGNMLVESTRTADEKADFWVKAERLLYQALVGLIVFEGKKEDKTMDTLIKFIDSSEVHENDEDAVNAVDLIFKELEERDPEHFAVRQYKKYKLAAGKSAKSILISCGVRLSPFDIKEIREITADDDMELDKIGDRKTAVFCVTSDTDTSLNFLISFMYMQMFNTLCTVADSKPEGKLPIHVRCLFDEFRNIGKIPMFETLIATIRSRNISACPIVQTKSQLKALYKDDAETIVGCCDTTLFLGGQEKSTLKDISELLGNQTIEVANTSRSYGRQGGNSISYQKTGRKLMDESEIFKLSGDKCILTIRGADPWCSKKYDIKKHPYYKYLGEADKKNRFDTAKFLENYRKEKFLKKIGATKDEDIVRLYFFPEDFEEECA